MHRLPGVRIPLPAVDHAGQSNALGRVAEPGDTEYQAVFDLAR